MSRIIYISLSTLLLLLEGNHQFPEITENVVTNIAAMQIIVPSFNVVSYLKAKRKRCIKLIYGEKDYRVCEYDKRVKGVYCFFLLCVC